MQTALSTDDTNRNLAEIAQLLDATLGATVPLSARIAATAQDIAAWLCAVRGKRGRLRHPRIALFATPQSAARIASLNAGNDQLCALSEEINADLQVYELPASADDDRTAQLQALTYGMMAVQPGLDALAVSVLDDTQVSTTWKTLDDVMRSSRADLAAALGALIAARLARVPVIIAGHGMHALVQVMENHTKGNAAHCLDAKDVPGLRLRDDAALDSARALAQIKHLAAIDI